MRIVPCVAALGLASLGLLAPCDQAAGAPNENAVAYLSWSATDHTATDLTTPGASNDLFVIYEGVDEFRGAHVEIVWDPPGNQADCFAQVGALFQTSSGTICTYLNRGSAVPLVTYDEPGHFGVAWYNSEYVTTCAAGAILYLTCEFDGVDCSDVPLTGCFRLRFAWIYDASGLARTIPLAGPVATVNGGGTHCDGLTPVQPATWGRIKEIFRR